MLQSKDIMKLWLSRDVLGFLCEASQSFFSRLCPLGVGRCQRVGEEIGARSYRHWTFQPLIDEACGAVANADKLEEHDEAAFLMILVLLQP
jgi:hypothetical protein